MEVILERRCGSLRSTKAGVCKAHVATDGSLLGKAGKMELAAGLWCSLTTMKRWGHCMGCMVSMEAEYEVQRTVKRAELTAFLCILKKVIGSIKVHVDNKGIIDALRKGEKECVKPRAGDADLWVKICEELHGLVERGILVEVEHVKAHRARRICRSLRTLSRQAPRRLMIWQKAGAMLDEGWQKQKQKLCSRKEKRCM